MGNGNTQSAGLRPLYYILNSIKQQWIRNQALDNTPLEPWNPGMGYTQLAMRRLVDYCDATDMFCLGN